MADGYDELQALLGEGTEFEGKLVFEGRVRIDGRFAGEIRTEGVLILGPRARIDAKIRAGTVIVKGASVAGEMHVQQLVELYAPAHVKANILAPQMFMDKGVVFDGKCTMLETEESDEGDGSKDPAPAAEREAPTPGE